MAASNFSRRDILRMGGLVLAGIAGSTVLSGCGSDSAPVAKNATAGASLAAVKARPEKVDAIPSFAWQKQALFPDKDAVKTTLAMNSMVSFLFFHGQGTIYLSIPKSVEAFNLYLNGAGYDVSNAGPGKWRLDVSEAMLDGMNTLQLSNISPLGVEDPITVYIPYPEVLPADEGQVVIDGKALQLVSDIVTSDVEHGFTSAQLAVVKGGRLVHQNAWGRVNSYEQDGTPKASSPKVTNDTLYDLASVTKMFSTIYAVQKLVTDGELDIDKRIVDIMGAGFVDDTLDIALAEMEKRVSLKTQKDWKRTLTVRDILCHRAGFPSDPHYNDPDYDMTTKETGAPGCNPCYATNREEMLKAICKTPLQFAPRTTTMYSDVDYMLSGFIVEKTTGKRLDDYLKETFFEPLGLQYITYNPLDNGFAPDDCAATELNGNTRDGFGGFPGARTETLQGQVHDERAWYCMEGVSGHAGLFACATDLAKLASVMFTGGYGEHRFFSRDILDGFMAEAAFDQGTWGIGWWRQGQEGRPWYFGTQAPSGVVGHQGWTGTLAMIDVSRDLVVVYLTNKINSPVVSKDDPNKFVGSCYTASTLGSCRRSSRLAWERDRRIRGCFLTWWPTWPPKASSSSLRGRAPRTRTCRTP